MEDRVYTCHATQKPYDKLFYSKKMSEGLHAGKERQLINITFHVAFTSLKLYSQRWHSGSLERSVSINIAFNWLWTLNIKKKPNPNHAMFFPTRFTVKNRLKRMEKTYRRE